MKKYKSLITSSLLAALIIVSPIVSFAENNNKDQNGNENKTEQSKNVKQNKVNSMFNMFSNWFNQRANAQTTNTNRTPSITGITAPTVLKLGEVGTWEVKASDSNNGALTYSVDWGDTNVIARSFAMLSQPVFIQTGTFTHSYATKGEYKITFTVSNTAGVKTTSKVTVRIVESPDTIAPVISSLAVSSIKVNKATLTWLTDTKSNSLVWISKTSPVDTSLNTNTSSKAQILKHKMMLNKLDTNTKYYVVVGGTNDVGTTKFSEISFTTKNTTNDGTPVITSLTGGATIVLGETETVTVNANDPKNEALTYSADWGDTSIIANNLLAVKDEPAFNQSATFTHVYTTTGTYTATFKVQNSEGKNDTSSMKITVTPAVVADGAAPVISNIETRVNDSSVTIAWTTNELSTSNISYSTITPLDVTASTTTLIADNSLATNHSLIIPGLTSNTLYHFILKSVDASSNAVSSNELSFRTN